MSLDPKITASSKRSKENFEILAHQSEWLRKQGITTKVEITRMLDSKQCRHMSNDKKHVAKGLRMLLDAWMHGVGAVFNLIRRGFRLCADFLRGVIASARDLMTKLEKLLNETLTEIEDTIDASCVVMGDILQEAADWVYDSVSGWTS